jgi:hypothetical protein
MNRITTALLIFTAVLCLHCGPPKGGDPSCASATGDGGGPDFQCAGVAPVTMTKLQADLLKPTCATPACHDGSPSTLSPTDYSTVAKSAANVGKTSTYGNGMMVVAANDLVHSTMWIKVLGGSPPSGQFSGPPPACISVGGIMPQTNTVPISAALQTELKGWICGGAPAQ